jgi:hypothetical protein
MEYSLTIAAGITAILAFLLSVFAFWWTYRTSVRPVLVFFVDEYVPGEITMWSIKNVGNGPALNVTICGGLTLDNLDESVCARLPALGPGDKERLSFLKKRCAFVATYDDLLNFSYTTTSFDSFNRYYLRNRYSNLRANLPLSWTKKQNKEKPQLETEGD